MNGLISILKVEFSKSVKSLFVLIFIFLMCFNALWSQNVVFPLIKDLKGSVKSVKEVQCIALIKAGKAVKGEQLKKSNYLMDTKGNLIEKDDYDSAGALIKRYVANYDANENLLEEMLYTPDSVISKYKYRYDGKNNRIGWMSFTTVDTAIARGSYHYDDKGRIISDSLFDAKGKLAECSGFGFEEDKLTKESHFLRGDKYSDTYEFDMDGNPIEDTRIGSDGNTISVSRLKYNNDGKLTETDILTSESDDYKPVEKKEYDNAGRITKVTKFLGAGTFENFVKYDSAGNIICDSNHTVAGDIGAFIVKCKYNGYRDTLERTIYSEASGLLKKYSYQYDSKRNRIEKDLQSKNENSKILIEYDRLGNPVKEIEYLNDQPVTITDREFVYY